MERPKSRIYTLSEIMIFLELRSKCTILCLINNSIEVSKERYNVLKGSLMESDFLKGTYNILNLECCCNALHFLMGKF